MTKAVSGEPGSLRDESTDVQGDVSGMAPESGPAGSPKGGLGGRRAVARQIVLPFRKSLEISWRNMRVRFLRSLITVMSLVLAVAFLSFVLVGTDIASGVLAEGGESARRMLLRGGFEIEGGTVVTGARDRWIIVLSLLVCTVGIINAQLMAVTERFREIGIMKCLGALDGMVLRLFLLEAGMQGLAGAFAGAIVGFLGALLVGLLRFGLAALTGLPVLDVLGSLGAATATGLLLSLTGVFYPALIASRMRPVKALESEH